MTVVIGIIQWRWLASVASTKTIQVAKYVLIGLVPATCGAGCGAGKSAASTFFATATPSAAVTKQRAHHFVLLLQSDFALSIAVPRVVRRACSATHKCSGRERIYKRNYVARDRKALSQVVMCSNAVNSRHTPGVINIVA